MSFLDDSSAPSAEPLTVKELKEFARIDETAEDPIILSLIKLARRACERYTQRIILQRTFILYLDSFPRYPEIDLQVGKVSAVTSLKYIDIAGDLVTFDSGSYYVDTIRPKGRIKLKENYSWPDISADAPNAVQITFAAGPETVQPDAIDMIQAIKSLVTYWHETRTPPDMDSIPKHVALMLYRFKL